MRGCDYCWAKDLHDKRHKAYLAGKKVPKQYSHPFGEIILRYGRLDEPLHIKKPSRFFVCSMSDLFHPLVPIGFLTHVFDIIEKCPQHTFLIFTKRLKQALKMMWGKHEKGWRYYGDGQFDSNIWFIVSCSTQKEVDENVPILLQIPAAVRGISLEPLLEEIDLKHIPYGPSYKPKTWGNKTTLIQSCINVLKHLNWVIVGCESGKNRRPCKTEWMRKIVKDCQTAGVAVYVKQLDIDGKVITDINKFPKDLQIREYP